MAFNLFGKSSLAALLLLLTVGIAGCQQRAASKLLGQWVGRPDTAAARAERESLKYGETSSASEETPSSTESATVTDWERYETGVRLEFVDHEHVEMSLSEGSKPLSGKWSIFSTSPIGCTIEVDTDGESDSEIVRRQFRLDLDEREGVCVGFTMMEEGADRQLGSLYFQRPEGM